VDGGKPDRRTEVAWAERLSFKILCSKHRDILFPIGKILAE
jgi:hypothetical protein